MTIGIPAYIFILQCKISDCGWYSQRLRLVGRNTSSVTFPALQPFCMCFQKSNGTTLSFREQLFPMWSSLLVLIFIGDSGISHISENRLVAMRPFVVVHHLWNLFSLSGYPATTLLGSCLPYWVKPLVYLFQYWVHSSSTGFQKGIFSHLTRRCEKLNLCHLWAK